MKSIHVRRGAFYMPRVLHIANTQFFVEHLLAGKLRGLSQAGYAIEVAAPRVHDPALPYPFHNLPIPRNLSPLGDIRALYETVRLLKSGRFDLVHTHSAKAGFIGRAGAWLCGLPSLHTAHGLPFYQGQPPLPRLLYRNLERLAAKCCNGVLCQNRADLQTLTKLHFLPESALFYEGNGVDVDALRSHLPERAAIRRELGLEERDVAVALFARLEPVKDHATFLSALSRVCAQDPRCVALLAGANFGRSGRYERELRASIERHPFRSRIKLLGFREDASRLLCGCDAAVLTSRKEGVPRILMEAMSIGLPVAATSAPGTRELVRHGVTGLLSPVGDSEALARNLLEIVREPELRARLGAAAARYAQSELAENAVIGRILRAYNGIGLR